MSDREPGEAYYVENGWSGCAGSAWHTLPPAAKDGWAHAERLVAGLRYRMAEAWERGNNDGLTFAAAPQKSLLTNPHGSPASQHDQIEDWCPRWAYGTCTCERMCPDDRADAIATTEEAE